MFFHPSEVSAKFDLPILGMVSAVMGDVDTKRRRSDRLRFVAASGSLVLLFAVGLTVMSLVASS